MKTIPSIYRRVEHPSYHLLKDAYICPACGMEFPYGRGAAKAHADHVYGVHGWAEAVDSISGKDWDRLHNPEIAFEKKVQAQNRAAICKAGFKRIKSSYFRACMGDYTRDGNFYSEQSALMIAQKELQLLE